MFSYSCFFITYFLKTPFIFRLFLIVLNLLICQISLAQVSVVSWNLQNLGQSKSPETLEQIADFVKSYDIVAIQEVVAGYGGTQAVAALSDILNRKGAKWSYVVSNPTASSAYKSERYAYLWKPSKVQLVNKPFLEKYYALEIDREPFFADFKYNGKIFTLVNFHAITKKMQPETEIKHFKYLPDLYPTKHLIFLGDFNCPETHSVFNPLKKMGYKSAFQNQKTTLRQKCFNYDCLASEFDNFFYKSDKITFLKAEVIHFYKKYEDVKAARKLSDHIPIVMIFDLL